MRVPKTATFEIATAAIESAKGWTVEKFTKALEEAFKAEFPTGAKGVSIEVDIGLDPENGDEIGEVLITDHAFMDDDHSFTDKVMAIAMSVFKKEYVKPEE